MMLECGEGRRKRWIEEIHMMSGLHLAELRDALRRRIEAYGEE